MRCATAPSLYRAGHHVVADAVGNNSGDSDATAPQSPGQVGPAGRFGAGHRVDEEVQRRTAHRAGELGAHRPDSPRRPIASRQARTPVPGAAVIGPAQSSFPSSRIRAGRRPACGDPAGKPCAGEGSRTTSTLVVQRSTHSVQPPAASGTRRASVGAGRDRTGNRSARRPYHGGAPRVPAEHLMAGSTDGATDDTRGDHRGGPNQSPVMPPGRQPARSRRFNRRRAARRRRCRRP